MIILGISCFYHDSAAALIRDGYIISAAQEERFSRLKHDDSFPIKAINFCLESAQIDCNDIDVVVFYEKPFVKFERILETFFAFAPRGVRMFARSMAVWITTKLFQKKVLIECLNEVGKRVDWHLILKFSSHHLSHAASAFYPSPFDNAAIVTLDGVGEWQTGTIAIGRGSDIQFIQEMRFPHSIGLLYSAFTYFCGFKVNSGEYKLMGLAPYGNPKFYSEIKDHVVKVFEDGSIQLDMSYFDYCVGDKMTSRKLERLLGVSVRHPESRLDQVYLDIAASIQILLEEIVLKLCKHAKEMTGCSNLCLAGGVALNCVANGKIIKEKIFDDYWIQPAAGDAGGALGAALAYWYLAEGSPRKGSTDKDSMRGTYLGPEYKDAEIEAALTECGAKFVRLSDDELYTTVAKHLSEGQAIGWMQGAMEFGPRALGNRSIIADPRNRDMQRQLNLKIKFRESFRPFAPSIIESKTSEWFDLHGRISPYMLIVADVKSADHPIDSITGGSDIQTRLKNVNSSIPAVTHVDGSARIQTVDPDTNPRFHRLLETFETMTACPILVNTSFNVRGEPIVCSPSDAFKCFMGTDLDMLVIGNYLLRKNQQDSALLLDYRSRYELD